MLDFRTLRPFLIGALLLFVLVCPLVRHRKTTATPDVTSATQTADPGWPAARAAPVLIRENAQFREPITASCMRHVARREDLSDRCSLWRDLTRLGLITVKPAPYNSDEQEIEITSDGRTRLGEDLDEHYGDRYTLAVARREIDSVTGVIQPPQSDASVRDCTRVEFESRWLPSKWAVHIAVGAPINYDTGSAYLEQVNGIWQIRELRMPAR